MRTVVILAVALLPTLTIADESECFFVDEHGTRVLYRSLGEIDSLQLNMVGKPEFVIVIRDVDRDRLLRSPGDEMHMRYLTGEEEEAGRILALDSYTAFGHVQGSPKPTLLDLLVACEKSDPRSAECQRWEEVAARIDLPDECSNLEKLSDTCRRQLFLVPMTREEEGTLELDLRAPAEISLSKYIPAAHEALQTGQCLDQGSELSGDR